MSRPSPVRDRRDKWDIRLQSYIGSAIRSVVGIRSNSSISSSSSGQCSDGKYFATSCIFGLANVGQFSGLMSVLSHVPWLWPANGTASVPPNWRMHSCRHLMSQSAMSMWLSRSLSVAFFPGHRRRLSSGLRFWIVSLSIPDSRPHRGRL